MPANSPLEPLYEELQRRFEGHLSGSSEGLFLVVSKHGLSNQSYKALSSSARADGFASFPYEPFPAPMINDEDSQVFDKQGPITILTIEGNPQTEQTKDSQRNGSLEESVTAPNHPTLDAPRPEFQDASSEGPHGDTSQTTKEAVVSRETTLTPADLILIIETLDPFAVVSVDMASAKLLADAYRTQIKLNTPQTLLGRPLRCFENFDSMISTQEGKQNAWKLLKNLAFDRP